MLDWRESSQRFKRYINFSEIFPYFSPPTTLKMRSRSLKSNQLLSLSKWYIYISLEKINSLNCPKGIPVLDWRESSSKLVTLKMGSRLPMYIKLFRLSLRYSCASLVGIKTNMQEIYHF